MGSWGAPFYNGVRKERSRQSACRNLLDKLFQPYFEYFFSGLRWKLWHIYCTNTYNNTNEVWTPSPPIYRLLSGGEWIERSLSTSSKEGYYSLSGSRSKWGGCRQSWAASPPHPHPRCQRRRPPPKWKQWNYIVDPNTLLTGADWRPSQAHRFLSPTSPWIPTSLAYDENGCIRTLHPGLWLMWWTQRSSLYVLQLDIVTAWGKK